LRGEFIDVGGARLYYYAGGSRGQGEPLLFIHGFPTSSHLWARVVPLVPPGHRVVVPDLLGFGRSDPPTERGAAPDFTVPGHVLRLTRLLDSLGIDQVGIIGHGIGAAIALAMQHEQPKRVTRLGLVNPVRSLTRSPFESVLLRVALPVLRVLPPATVLRLVRRRLLRAYRDSAAHGPTADLYLRPFHAPGGRATLVGHLRDLAARSRSRARDSLAAPLITAPGPPTTIVCGDADPLVPIPAAKRLQVRLPRSTFESVGGGHFSPEESPEQLAMALKRLLSSS